MNNGIRHPASIKNIAKKLRREGKTHREIAKLCHISTASAHLWTVGIILSDEQKKAIMMRRNKPLMTSRRKIALQKLARLNLGKYWLKRKYTTQYLLSKIRKFYKKHNRIPLKREFNQFAEYRRRFGSWNKGVKAAGFTPNNVIFSKKYTAQDGHICDSFSERIIDDYLSKNGIMHQRNVPYPGTKMSADFKVRDILIEYFGLTGVQKNYDRLVQTKRDFCRKNGYNLLEIYPSVLFAPGFRRFFIKNLKRFLQETKNISVAHA